jgi:glycosyltransferase involved in cell wall biosynthesis
MTEDGAAAPELVVFSPLPPSRSGIAAYTAELLPALGRLLRTVVVLARDEDAAAAGAPEGAAEVLSERAYRRRPALHALPHLHQLGNSLDHAHVYRAALRRPGVVVLHDVVLHHLVEALTLGRGSPAAYEAVLGQNHGPGGRRLARMRRAGLFSPMQRFLMPLHRQVLDAALGVVVHSRFAAGRLQGPPDLPLRVIPHHLSPRAAAFDGVTKAEARARLGLPADGWPVLLALGRATPAKGLGVALEAVAVLRDGGFGLHLVVGGEVEPGLPLAAQVAALGLEDRVTVTGWLPEQAFFLHLRAADLLHALRFPVAGESSGTLARALAMGTPAIAYDFGPAAEYPDAAVAKLPFGPDPAPALARALPALLADPDALAARGEAARRHMREACGVGASAAALAEAALAWAPSPSGRG